MASASALQAASGFKGKNLIVIGAGWAGQTIASVIARDETKRVVGFIDDAVTGTIFVDDGKAGRSVPVLGGSTGLFDVVKEQNVDGVVFSVGQDCGDSLLVEIVKCHRMGVPVYDMANLYERLTDKVPVHQVGSHWIVPILTMSPTGVYSAFSQALNFLLGVVGFFLVLVPLYPLIAFAIKLDSQGPVLFRQERVGKKGKPFNLFKFRTMFHAKRREGEAWTQKGDKRITRVGQFLRKFRLDELPQFFNVIKGEMAVIGPRPEAVELVEEFRTVIPFYDYRYLVLPGITGWAQVNYGNTCSIQGTLEKLQYDLYWIKYRSIWLDLKIVVKSVKVMLTGYGSV